MGITTRTARADDWAAMLHVDGRTFGYTPPAEWAAEPPPTIDLDRFHLAFDGAELVGIVGSFAFDVTLPGAAAVPMGGVTWVSVATTHRRRGVLTQLMSACHRRLADRGEPVAMLSASESGIYERFGYGAATRVRVTRLDRRRARIRPDLVPADRSVRFLDGDAALDHVHEVWDRFRRTRAGEVSRPEGWRRFIGEMRNQPQGPQTRAFYLTHPDGYAAYRMENHWNDGAPAHEIHLAELAAVTDEAHLALWHALLGMDLVGPINSRQLPIDDPLPYLLDDPRVLRTTDLNDGIWVHVLDVPTTFSARTYRTEETFVVEVDGTRYRIEGGSGGGSCRVVRSRPDLVLTPSAIGALSLGGVSVTELVRGRRATARSAAVLDRADAFFTTALAPHCQTFY